MSKVVMQTIVSVDGFIATADDEVGPLFDWLGTGDTPLYDEDGPRVTKQSHDYYRPMLDAIGELEAILLEDVDPLRRRRDRCRALRQ